MKEQKAPNKHRFQTITLWKRRHPRRFLAAAFAGVLIFVFATIGIVYALQPQQKVAPSPAKIIKKPTPQAPKFYSPLTGREVKDSAATTQAVTAIMIENSPDARPQSGLKQAGVVYEAIAEGGITRFLAIYQEAKPQLIGPVRSVRMYYIDWSAPYN
ncbi:MAG: DUF3048 domain-containing protein, partial [Candidatus Saccharibacteria bacterium]|nr:DUF3048 domain-containing protein [Candidatus Saccharibacteria bacterium]